MKWEKCGLLFDPRTVCKSWCGAYAQAPATLVFKDFVRVYFSCRPTSDAQGQYVSYTAWVDLDRSNLFKILRVAEHPILTLGGLGCFDEHGVYPASVIRLGGDVVSCYYAGWSRKQSVRFDTAIGVALSHDGGETFHRVGEGPVLAASIHEPFVLSGPKVRRFDDMWWMFYIAGREWRVIDGRTEPIYKIRSAASKDGFLWHKMNEDMIPNALGDDEVQSGPDVHLGADGFYHMFFCFRPVGNNGGLRIGYAWSSNLLTWTRDDSLAGITVSEQGWDSEMVRYPHVFEIDGQWLMLYNGNEFGKFGFGLARRVG
jgi:predicted GH43/DUF377 family glycosyl hydrolase